MGRIREEYSHVGRRGDIWERQLPVGRIREEYSHVGRYFGEAVISGAY